MNAANSSEFPTVEFGRYRRFREEAIARMVEELERGAAAAAAGTRRRAGSGCALTWRGAATAAARANRRGSRSFGHAGAPGQGQVSV
jgi:hypothetical protein